MNDILKAPFDAFDRALMTEEEWNILREAEPVLNEAEKKLSVEEWDTLWGAAWRASGADSQNLFATGFRLGMQLTLAGLEPVAQGQK